MQVHWHYEIDDCGTEAYFMPVSHSSGDRLPLGNTTVINTVKSWPEDDLFFNVTGDNVLQRFSKILLQTIFYLSLIPWNLTRIQ